MKSRMNPLYLSSYTATSALGHGLAQTQDALKQSRSHLVPCAFDDVDLNTYIGKVNGVEEVSLPVHLSRFNCRNNQLAQLGLAQDGFEAVSYTHLQAHETPEHLVCRLLLEKKNNNR